MNNKSAFAPSDSLKGEPQKLLAMKFVIIAKIETLAQSPLQGI